MCMCTDICTSLIINVSFCIPDWSESRDKHRPPLCTGIPPNATSSLLVSTTTGGGGEAQAGTGKPRTLKQNFPTTDTQAHTTVTAGDKNEAVVQNPGNSGSANTSHLPALYHGHVEPLPSLVPSTERSEHLFELLLDSHTPRGTPSRSSSPSVDERFTDGSVSPIVLPDSSSVRSKSPDSSSVVSSHNETFSLTDVSVCSLVLSQPADNRHPQFPHGEEEEESGAGDRPSEPQQQAREEGATKLKQAVAESPEVSFEEEPHSPKASELSQTDGGSTLESHYSVAPLVRDNTVTEVPEKVTAIQFAGDCEQKNGGPTGAKVSLMLTSPSKDSTLMSTAPTMPNRDAVLGGSRQQKDALSTSSPQHHRLPESSTVVPTALTMSGGGVGSRGGSSLQKDTVAVPTKTHHQYHTQR